MHRGQNSGRWCCSAARSQGTGQAATLSGACALRRSLREFSWACERRRLLAAAAGLGPANCRRTGCSARRHVGGTSCVIPLVMSLSPQEHKAGALREEETCLGTHGRYDAPAAQHLGGLGRGGRRGRTPPHTTAPVPNISKLHRTAWKKSSKKKVSEGQGRRARQA